MIAVTLTGSLSKRRIISSCALLTIFLGWNSGSEVGSPRAVRLCSWIVIDTSGGMNGKMREPGPLRKSWDIHRGRLVVKSELLVDCHSSSPRGALYPPTQCCTCSTRSIARPVHSFYGRSSPPDSACHWRALHLSNVNRSSHAVRSILLIPGAHPSYAPSAHQRIDRDDKHP